MIDTEDLEQIYSSVISPEQQTRMQSDISEIFQAVIRDSVNRLTVSEWAEQKRILPKGLTSMPGPFRWEVTPYLREIADCFSESSPIQKVAVMKGARVGLTVGVAESWIGYVIDAAPGPMMFISGDKETAEAAVEVRLDRMILSAGLAHKIFAQAKKTHGKKTGDTKSKKEFAGGFLLALGPNVGAKLRSFGIRYLIFDEIDAYPQELQDEGDPIMLAERRTDEFERLRKILYISTPLIEQTSRIKPLFLSGDQRYYYVPCKHCGHMQRLIWRDKNGAYRLKYEQDELGRLIWVSVHYECEKCGGHWKNSDKAWFLERGEWRPTAIPEEPNFRSYHISSLYSPVGMRSWGSIIREWIKTKNDPIKLRPFVNTVLGETWVERGEAPSYEKIMLRRDAYTSGSLPEEAQAFFLTAAADIQKDRIEVEILAWGKDKESWSVAYLILPGNTDYADNEVWELLADVLTSKHAGMGIEIALIDCGYITPVVHTFCEKYQNVHPCHGSNIVAKMGRIFIRREIPEFRILKRVDIYAHELKTELYRYLRMAPPEPGQPYPAGYCHFPQDYTDRYFRMLTSEELVKEKTRTGTVKLRWRTMSGRRNEAHDIRIYNMTALLVYMSIAADEAFARPITTDEFWEWAERRSKPQKVLS